MREDLERLAELIRIKNDADLAIAQLIGRPCAPGTIGEFVAAHVFAIELMRSGSHPGYDGVFQVSIPTNPITRSGVFVRVSRRPRSGRCWLPWSPVLTSFWFWS
jgi:hypothetical protein